MAESELGVLSFQCLDRRIADQQMLKEEVDAWEADRNKKHAKALDPDKRIRWLFPCRLFLFRWSAALSSVRIAEIGPVP
jgi:hypothetical protein